MQKLHLTFITLFMLFAAQAQTIAEADVMGTWLIKKASLNGCNP